MPSLPTLTVLDKFNRASGALTAPWVLIQGMSVPGEVFNEKYAWETGTSEEGAYWSSSEDWQPAVQATLAVLANETEDAGKYMTLWAALHLPGSAGWEGYCLRIVAEAAKGKYTVKLLRRESGGTFKTLEEKTAVTIAANDLLALSAQPAAAGETVVSWWQNGTRIQSFKDVTSPLGKGFIGIGTNGKSAMRFDDFSAAEFEPTLATFTATSITNTTATLRGEIVNPNLIKGAYYFEYGVTPSANEVVTGQTGYISSELGKLGSKAITGLTAGTLYYYRFLTEDTNSKAITQTGVETFATTGGVAAKSTTNPPRAAVRDRWPLRLLVNGEDMSFEISEGFTFASTDPGGFESASFPIPRDLPFAKRGDHVRLECGLRVAWEGRVKEVQRSLGNRTLLQCEGYRALLRDQTMAEIFCDRDLTKWVGPSVEQQKTLISEGQSPISPVLGFSPETLTPSIILDIPGPWEVGGLPQAEAFYISNGIPIKTVYYEWNKGPSPNNVNNADKNWEWGVVMLVPGGGSTTVKNKLVAEEHHGAFLITEHVGVTRVRIFAAYRVAAGGGNLHFLFYWTKLAVYGEKSNTYIAALGESAYVPGVSPTEYYPWGIAQFVASECSGLNPGIIGIANEFAVAHAAYLTPVPMEQIVEEMAKLVAWTWGVWEPLPPLAATSASLPRMDFRERPGPGKWTVYAWRRDCESVDIRENLENLFNSAKVTWREPSGEENSVTVTTKNVALEQQGLTRQIALNIGLGTKESAEKFGALQLALIADQQRGGSVTVLDPVREPNGAEKPAWLLRAGVDRLRIPDLPCSDVWGAHNDFPITRVEAAGSEMGIVTTLELGIGPNLIETLNARVQVEQTAAG